MISSTGTDQMNDPDFFLTIEAESVAEFKDRGSRFIAYAFPITGVENFKKKLNELKAAHPKAVHHCFAWRIGTDGNLFRVSDDGEPSGTAGRPILGQIDSKSLVNVGIVVVRYFGGTLLGVPGLINAYKTVSSLVLQTIPMIRKPLELLYRLQFDYTMMNPVMTIVKKYDCHLIEQDLQLFCRMDIGIPKFRLEETLHHLRDLHTVTVEKI
jgi:uncharacterized YigZ family protein